MHKYILAASGFLVGLLPVASVSAEPVRYPTNGNPALIISVPGGWTHRPVAKGDHLEPFVFTSPHGIEVTALIVPYPDTPEMFARQLANVSHLEMKSPKSTQLLGFPGYMFDGAYTTFGTPFNVHIAQAKLDKVHMALIEVRSPAQGPTTREMEEGRQVVEHLKLAPVSANHAESKGHNQGARRH